jgi:ABC-type transport system involved in multi-copper enzyme maturation permease subunit
MHPILYSEIKQIQQSYKSILFFILILVTARATLGDYGHLINLFFFFPIIAGALGTGLLDQEYSRDYIKYLYTLPIKRWHFIFIKMTNAIVAAVLFLLIIYVIKWLIPPRITIPMVVFVIIFNLTPLLIFCIVLALFNYAVCTFAITFLKSPKMAGPVNYILLIIALIYLGYCFVDTGYKYKTLDYILIFTPTSFILTVGGFYLFMLRNPFLNRNPRHFLTGLLIAAISIAYFTGSTQWITYGQSKDIFEVNEIGDILEFDKGVEWYSISPDGEFVFVKTSFDRLVSHSYILNSSGKLIADLGKNSSSFHYVRLWQFNNGKRMMVYEKKKPILAEIGLQKSAPLFALDLDNLKQYAFENIINRYKDKSYSYKNLDNRTLQFYGIGYVSASDNDAGLLMFKQNILSGSVKTTPIPDSNKVWADKVKYIDSEHIVFISKFKHEQDSDPRPQLNIFGLKEHKVDKILLPEGVDYYGDYILNGDRYYFVERLSDEHGYSYRVASRAVGGIEKVHLTPQELPKFSYREVAEKGLFGAKPSLSVSPRKKWIMCRYKNRQEQNRFMLLDQEGNRIDVNMDVRSIVFAPGEMRFFSYHKYTDKHVPQIIRVYDIVGRQIVLVKEFAIEDNSSDFRFLNDNTMLYVKNPTPEEKWVNNKYLVKLDIETMESTPFFGQPP